MSTSTSEAVVPVYFFTTEYPLRRGGTSRINTVNTSTGKHISSLEEAQELAENHRVDANDKTSCVTTYGVYYSIA